MIRLVRMMIFSFFAIMVVTPTIAKDDSPPTTNQCASDLTQSNITQTAVLVWANEAAVSVFSYNFVNYETALQSASSYFTPDGWSAFSKSSEQTNNLNAVIEKKLIISAVATRSPIILQQGILDGRYSWRVQMPLLVTYQSASEYAQQSLIVTMLISRTSPYEGVRGIGITQFVTEPYKDKK